MQQLTPLDASFLYLESPRTHMHIGGVYLFNAPTHQPVFDFEAAKANIQRRLHLSRIFRQRLVWVPLDLDHPYWVEDPDFDLDYHICHVGLPLPAGRKELMELAGQFFSKPLNRERPLWELVFVSGLTGFNMPSGSYAILSKVHHAAIDGMSGAELMAAIFDWSDEPGVIPPPEKAWVPGNVPSGVELLRKSYSLNLAKPLQMAKLLTETASGTIGMALKNLTQKLQAPPSLFSAPRVRFNVTITPHRIVDCVGFPLQRIKKIKNEASTLGTVTINDVLLCICAGALRKYLIHHHDLPHKSLVAMTPVSVRSKDEEGAMGNVISAMLVSLNTDVMNPKDRLHAIHRSTVRSKTYQKAVKAENLMKMLPSQLAARAAHLYIRMRASEKHSPLFNLVITNVPGPPFSLYMNGAQLDSHFGIAPLFDGLGLFLTIFSCADTISIGVTACKEVMPDLPLFMDYLRLSVDQLEESLLPTSAPETDHTETPASPPKTSKKRTAKAKEKS
jgi:diacylglycerol O-acyltransferase